MKIMVTGGAGFIGSNFVRHVLDTHADDEVVTFDALTYAGNLENLTDLEGNARHTFVRGNISRHEDVEAIFEAHAVDAVVNFAAESHVDRSLHVGADAFINTNVAGVQILLDHARKQGVARFLQVSTDEVYGSLGPSGKFTEKTPLQPNNPYAATKAGADFLVRAAQHSHDINAVITRCSNNFGPYQFPEKLIPLMITNALADEKLPVYGDGMNVRDWIYVLDHCSAIDVVLRKAAPGSIYNIGGGHDVPNIDIVKSILDILDKPYSLIEYVKDRPGHDRRYAMDSETLTRDLGWRAAHSFEQALQQTVAWYLDNRTWWEHIRSGEYTSYYENMYGHRLRQT